MTLFDTGAAPDDPEASSGGPVVRVRMLVAYNGEGFHGFAAQEGVPTVGGTLSRTLSRVLRLPGIELTCAGRTDAGVHAWGQVVSFDVPAAALVTGGASFPNGSLDRLQQAVNKLCGPAVVVRDAAIVDGSFDARRSATARRYRYTIVNRPWPDPFLASTAWHVPVPLDRRALETGSYPFIGEHDFSSFCRRAKLRNGDDAPLVRRVTNAWWEEADDGVLRFWIEANAFCHQMVRSIVGTLVDVGRGKRHAGDILAILAARDRHAAGDLAPAHGLCLWAVSYDDPAPGA